MFTFIINSIINHLCQYLVQLCSLSLTDHGSVRIIHLFFNLKNAC